MTNIILISEFKTVNYIHMYVDVSYETLSQ